MMSTFFVAKQPAIVLFDSGASHTFINRAFVMRNQLQIQASKNKFCIQYPGGRIYTNEVVEQVPIELLGYTFPTNPLVLENQDIDVILGMNWMSRRGPVIDTLSRTIQEPTS